MPLDPRTILALSAVSHVLQLVALGVQYRVNRSYRGIGLWLSWSALVAAGFGFSLAREIPGFRAASILGQNVLIVLGVSCLYVGLARFFGRPERHALLGVFLAAYAGGMAALVLVVDHFVGRTALLAAALAAIAFLSAREVRSGQAPKMSSAARFLEAVLLAHGLFFALRAALLPFLGLDEGFFRPTPGTVLPLVEGFVAGNLLTVGVILMTNQRAHAEAVEARDHFRRLFETSPDAVAITRLGDGGFVDVNEGFERLSGHRRDEILSSTSVGLGVWADPADRGRIAARLRETGECSEVEVRFRRRDGRGVVASLSARLLPVRGEPHILSVTRDVTERKKAEEALERSAREIRELNAGLEARVAERTAELVASNRELEGLVHTIAHDLRAPLRAIDGFGALLDEGHAEGLGPSGRQLLGRVRGAAQAMDRLIRDLIQYAAAGSAPMRPGPVDATALARAALNAAAPPDVLASFRVSLRELPAAWGDEALLGVVFRELVSNAVRFSLPTESRRIEIDGRIEGGASVYRVADAGVGFDPAHAGQLFGTFQRLHPRDGFEGTGIGLAIVKRIVERHGGEVRAEGAVGAGASFSFTLPLRGGGDAR